MKSRERMLSYREKRNLIHRTEYEETELLPQPLPVPASICSLEFTPIGDLSVQSGDCAARRLQGIQVLPLGTACVNPEPSSIMGLRKSQYSWTPKTWEKRNAKKICG